MLYTNTNNSENYQGSPGYGELQAGPSLRTSPSIHGSVDTGALAGAQARVAELRIAIKSLDRQHILACKDPTNTEDELLELENHIRVVNQDLTRAKIQCLQAKYAHPQVTPPATTQSHAIPSPQTTPATIPEEARLKMHMTALPVPILSSPTPPPPAMSRVESKYIIPAKRQTPPQSPTPAPRTAASRVESKYVIPARRQTPPQPPSPAPHTSPLSWADDIPDYGPSRFVKPTKRHRRRRRHWRCHHHHHLHCSSQLPDHGACHYHQVHHCSHHHPKGDHPLTPQALQELKRALGPAYQNCTVLVLLPACPRRWKGT
ncbi:hypothetical protein K435DRAFT_881150 [Dendrothele bispora CBS 962.96]|uniref:Uncharacterized protein n=1 Tax=Dendrothele bispora (strain CBS 962.96) TaxID=1314807 RepID=A0A4S8KIY3_DENBC|nr:hypothetical protein K435DRAFT_881150 [Dendrothele bispora CBS 962.96]